MLLLSWVLTPCGFVGRYQHFGEICYLYFRAEVTRLGSTQILYKAFTDKPGHFSPEDGENMLLRNAVIYVRNQTAPKPKTTPAKVLFLYSINLQVGDASTATEISVGKLSSDCNHNEKM
jgi:hypothetical protein